MDSGRRNQQASPTEAQKLFNGHNISDQRHLQRIRDHPNPKQSSHRNIQTTQRTQWRGTLSRQNQTSSGEIIESAKRLAVFALAQARHHNAEAKDYTIKALKSSVILKHLEIKGSGKWAVFSLEFIEQYNEANYQQQVPTLMGSEEDTINMETIIVEEEVFHEWKNFFEGCGRRLSISYSNYSSQNN